MVQLVEVEDEHFQQGQPGPEEEGDYTDTGKHHLLWMHVLGSQLGAQFSVAWLSLPSALGPRPVATLPFAL